MSADGSHFFFLSGDELEPGDDRGEDIYQQVGTSLTRLTTYPEPEGGCVDLVEFADTSSDGGTVLFSTNAQVVPEDTDSTADVYKRRPDGSFVLASRGTDGGQGQCGFGGDRPIALSADGATAIFETTSRLSPADMDSSNDLYSADDSGAIELLSTGPTDANADGRANNIFPEWLALASDDAQRVAFETHHRLVAADRDNAIDVYLRSAGETQLVSAGLGRTIVKSNAELHALSGDGTTIVIAGKEQLAKNDLDQERDFYLWNAERKRPLLISGERIPPNMRIAKRGKRLRDGRITIRLLCPKAETSGPCHGRLVLKRGRGGPRIGSAYFRIEAGHRQRVSLRPGSRFRAQLPKNALAQVRALDALANSSTVVRKVTLREGR